jgi:hypothetical protein
MGDMFHMSHEAHLFSSVDDLASRGAAFDGFAWKLGAQRWTPLYEGKHIWHYDHRYNTGEGADQDKVRLVTDKEHDQPSFDIATRHYVDEQEVGRKLTNRSNAQWLMSWRSISAATNQRTLVVSVFPRSAAANSLPLLLPEVPVASVRLMSAMSSLPCDYAVRQKQSGANVLKSAINQIPVPHPDTFSATCPWDVAASLGGWVGPRVVELFYTSWSLQTWANRRRGYRSTVSMDPGAASDPPS